MTSHVPRHPQIRQFQSTADIDRAITKLRKRVADIEALKSESVTWTDARVANVQDEVSNTVREIFGEDSPQFNRHGYFRINDGPVRRLGHGENSKEHYRKVQETFIRHIPDAIARVEGLISHLQERREELAEPAGALRTAFEGRSFNPAIAEAAAGLFRSGHYAEAVGAASKALVALVKARSGSNADGAGLMQTVFSTKKPTLAFNSGADQSDADEQQGMMHLFIGAVMAIRNPAAHRVGTTASPERALQQLEVLSFLADCLDDAKRVN